MAREGPLTNARPLKPPSRLFRLRDDYPVPYIDFLSEPTPAHPQIDYTEGLNLGEHSSPLSALPYPAEHPTPGFATQTN